MDPIDILIANALIQPEGLSGSSKVDRIDNLDQIFRKVRDKQTKQRDIKFMTTTFALVLVLFSANFFLIRLVEQSALADQLTPSTSQLLIPNVVEQSIYDIGPYEN